MLPSRRRNPEDSSSEDEKPQPRSALLRLTDKIDALENLSRFGSRGFDLEMESSEVSADIYQSQGRRVGRKLQRNDSLGLRMQASSP